MGYCSICTKWGEVGNPLFCQLSRDIPFIGSATLDELTARGFDQAFVIRLSYAWGLFQQTMIENGCDSAHIAEAAARLEILREIFLRDADAALTS